MAVVVETTLGDFTIDLFVETRPQACKNFLKLCKMKYYNFCLFHSVQPNFLAQTGDPSGLGNGGESIYGLLYGENARYFEAEMMPKLKHNKPGLVSMVNCGNNMLGSQFFITLGEELVSLDQEHCVFGEITEGIEIVLRFNEAICDNLHRPYKDIRISHTVILEDPFEDPSGLIAPDMSPELTQEKLANGRIGADETVDETAGLSAVQVEEMKQEREARARATILEIVGDLPDADMAPPENVLFVCKLNPVTTDDDLEIIFGRFGKVKSCEVIRDKNTGDSLQYAFVEFENQKACEEAYFKMDNVLIDDRRIHVDFSQSVAKMRWRGKGRGVDYFDGKEPIKDIKSTSHRDRDESKNRSSNRRDRDYEERERRRDRGRDRGREDERQVRDRDSDRGRERAKDKEGDERHRRRDDRDRSRSDWRKRDGKRDRKDDYRDDDKRYDSKRRDVDGSRKREDDSKRVSSSRKYDEKKSDEKRSDERKREKESKDMNGRSSSQSDLIKSESVENPEFRGSTEMLEVKKDRERESKYSSPLLNISKEDTLSESCFLNIDEELVKSPNLTVSQPISDTMTELKTSQISRRSSKDDRKHEEIKKEDLENVVEDEINKKTDGKIDETKQSENNKKVTKRKQRVSSEIRKKKKRQHSSSSESSSESSDSSDSSSSSDSSDYRHSKRKKLIVAKRYYRGGKLVKEIKKKRRTKDSSESDSASDDSSDSDSKKKKKSKKHKKVINIFKHPKKKSAHSSNESQSESSSSEDSEAKSKKKKRKVIDKQAKKKTKHVSSKKKRKKKEESTSSSDSDSSVKNKSINRKHKKLLKNLKSETILVSTTSE